MTERLKEALCMCLHNCADCFCEEERKTECNPAAMLKNDIFSEDKTSFCLEYYPGENVQRQLIKIASEHDYTISILPDQCMIVFSKKEKEK